MVAAAYIAQAPDIVIENGVACVTAMSNGKTLKWHLPLREFRVALAIASQVLAKHDRAGDVVPFSR